MTSVTVGRHTSQMLGTQRVGSSGVAAKKRVASTPKASVTPTRAGSSELGEHPGAQDRPQSWQGADDLGVRVLLKTVGQLEDRVQLRSTIVTSQLPGALWHEALGEPSVADVI